MAQGILDHLAGDRFEALSAGSHPAGYVHSMAIKVMAEMGIDISHNESKSLDEYVGKEIDFIVTVCDNAKEACPVFPGKPTTAHWGFEDPVLFRGDEEEMLWEFRSTAMEIETRIRLFLALPEDQLSEREFHAAIRDLGK